jgi:hypothetical protein
MDEVIGGKDDDRRFRVRVRVPNPCQGKKDPGGGVAVRGLKDDALFELTFDLIAREALVLPGDDGYGVFGPRQERRPVERVLEHRAGPHERAVLLGHVPPDPAHGEVREPLSAPARQHDGPKTRRSAYVPGHAFRPFVSVYFTIGDAIGLSRAEGPRKNTGCGKQIYGVISGKRIAAEVRTRS